MPSSFTYAIHGLRWSINNNRNFIIHLGFSCGALFLGILLHISKEDLFIIIFTIMLGLIVEMLNTAVEEMTNLLTVKWSVHAKIAKDVSAGMMLLTAIFSIIIAFLIFIPYLINL